MGFLLFYLYELRPTLHLPQGGQFTCDFVFSGEDNYVLIDYVKSIQASFPCKSSHLLKRSAIEIPNSKYNPNPTMMLYFRNNGWF